MTHANKLQSVLRFLGGGRAPIKQVLQASSTALLVTPVDSASQSGGILRALARRFMA